MRVEILAFVFAAALGPSATAAPLPSAASVPKELSADYNCPGKVKVYCLSAGGAGACCTWVCDATDEVVLIHCESGGYDPNGKTSDTWWIDFLRAYIADPTEQNAREIVEKTTRGFKVDQEGWQTQHGGNTVILTKQAAAYAVRFGTKYIALFDWDSLFLWDFAGTKIYSKDVANTVND